MYWVLFPQFVSYWIFTFFFLNIWLGALFPCLIVPTQAVYLADLQFGNFSAWLCWCVLQTKKPARCSAHLVLVLGLEGKLFDLDQQSIYQANVHISDEVPMKEKSYSHQPNHTPKAWELHSDMAYDTNFGMSLTPLVGGQRDPWLLSRPGCWSSFCLLLLLFAWYLSRPMALGPCLFALRCSFYSAISTIE